ncbi:NUDIX domain-containing protein [Halosimplex litoreum]|uniref:NUDIX domain-containing protein n=1 Tax=Halosimplex litoreum TaxID=1198301 RepID=A0A7T3FXG5_9EURY|nr:NUDIX domain-containing protein [Halosimplex litoreum]QPV62093.1 NUDIX domain-containing protein [Halosimplex litoreum]
MAPEHVNREAVERRRDRLQAEYGEVPVERIRDEVPPERFATLCAESREGYIGGAYCWVVREPDQTAPLTESMPDDLEADRRVLMILNRADERWGLPGGGQEGDETFEAAAVREVREETGVDCEVTDTFHLRRVTAESTGDRDERLHALYVFFDAAYVDGHIAVQPGELNGAAWFAEPPERLQPANAVRADDFWPDFEADDPLGDRSD